MFHCFTETAEVARAALDLGFYISFSGILTFKSAQDLREVAAFVPLDRLLIETDSPYLAPVPYRGKTNNPSYVPYVARQLAELRQMPVEDIAAAHQPNFERLFEPGAIMRNYFKYLIYLVVFVSVFFRACRIVRGLLQSPSSRTMPADDQRRCCDAVSTPTPSIPRARTACYLALRDQSLKAAERADRTGPRPMSRSGRPRTKVR